MYVHYTCLPEANCLIGIIPEWGRLIATGKIVDALRNNLVHLWRQEYNFLALSHQLHIGRGVVLHAGVLRL